MLQTDQTGYCNQPSAIKVCSILVAEMSRDSLFATSENLWGTQHVLARVISTLSLVLGSPNHYVTTNRPVAQA